MTLISVLVPTRGRATKLAAVSQNIHESTVNDHEILFVAESEDIATHEAVKDLGDRLHINRHRKCYTGALNSAFPDSKGRYIFTGSDDLLFHQDWDEEVLGVLKDGIMVGGTNDLMHPQVQQGVMATHLLIDRKYIEETGAAFDEPPGTIMHEGYGHHFGESELCSLAIHRGVFAPCLDAIVQHMHWSRSGQRDATTELNEQREGGDHQLCIERCLKFLDPAVMANEPAYIEWARGRLQDRGVL